MSPPPVLYPNTRLLSLHPGFPSGVPRQRNRRRPTQIWFIRRPWMTSIIGKLNIILLIHPLFELKRKEKKMLTFSTARLLARSANRQRLSGNPKPNQPIGACVVDDVTFKKIVEKHLEKALFQRTFLLFSFQIGTRKLARQWMGFKIKIKKKKKRLW